MEPRASIWPEGRLQRAVLVIARVALGYLFFTQLFWKLPPRFGCPADFAVTSGTPAALTRTGGLCDWIGIEAVWSSESRPWLATNLDNQGGPDLFVPLDWAARLNGAILQGFIEPNIAWLGWLLWLVEAAVAVSLILGLFSRLGAILALLDSAQLLVGLAGIQQPYEWEWTYNLMVLLSLLLIAYPAGRVLGLDALIRARLAGARSGLARMGMLLS